MVGVHISTDIATFDIVVLRAGIAEEEVLRVQAVTGRRYPMPPDAAERGCRWPVAAEISLPAGARNGFYYVSFRDRESGAHLGDAYFVYRDPARPARIALSLSSFTYAAYSWYGGRSLYADTNDAMSFRQGTHRVSLNRPMPRGFLRRPDFRLRITTMGEPDRSIPAIGWCLENGYDPYCPPAGWFYAEYPIVKWLEQRGYEVDIVTNLDLHRDPQCLEGASLLLVVGKDEYWSWEMRDSVEDFVARGGNAAFLAGCTLFWQVRFDEADQAVECYKIGFRDDPVFGSADESRLTGIWSSPRVGRPENQLTGVSFTRGGATRFGNAVPRSQGGYVVYRPDHWLLDGTGLEYGDMFGELARIASYECDGCLYTMERGYPVPTGEDGTPDDFTIVAMFPASMPGSTGEENLLLAHAAATEVEYIAEQMTGRLTAESIDAFSRGVGILGAHGGDGKGVVITVGATDWVYGLVEGDSIVERITDNLLQRLC